MSSRKQPMTGSEKLAAFFIFYLVLVVLTLIDVPGEWLTVLGASILMPLIAYAGLIVFGTLLKWLD